MQISKFPNIFVLTRKQYAEDFTLKHRIRSGICARDICEKFDMKKQ